MSKKHKDYRYAIEYRRKLRDLEHPKEVILVKEDSLDDQTAELERAYGYCEHEIRPGAHGWVPITDDLPFPDPDPLKGMRNSWQDGGYF